MLLSTIFLRAFWYSSCFFFVSFFSNAIFSSCFVLSSFIFSFNFSCSISYCFCNFSISWVIVSLFSSKLFNCLILKSFSAFAIFSLCSSISSCIFTKASFIWLIKFSNCFVSFCCCSFIFSVCSLFSSSNESFICCIASLNCSIKSFISLSHFLFVFPNSRRFVFLSSITSFSKLSTLASNFVVFELSFIISFANCSLFKNSTNFSVTIVSLSFCLRDIFSISFLFIWYKSIIFLHSCLNVSNSFSYLSSSIYFSSFSIKSVCDFSNAVCNSFILLFNSSLFSSIIFSP